MVAIAGGKKNGEVYETIWSIIPTIEGIKKFNEMG